MFVPSAHQTELYALCNKPQLTSKCPAKRIFKCSNASCHVQISGVQTSAVRAKECLPKIEGTKMTVKRGEVYYADLNPVVGSEQGGIRPIVVLQNDVGNKFSPTVIAAATTSRLYKAKLPTHVGLSRAETPLPKDSVVLLEQIRTIDKSRLKDKIGELPAEVMQKIDNALLVSLGF